MMDCISLGLPLQGIYMYINLCVYVFMYVDMYIRIYVHLCIHPCVSMYDNIYTHIYTGGDGVISVGEVDFLISQTIEMINIYIYIYI
jgi:hypothetical protein